jgi:hypothetical protein
MPKILLKSQKSLKNPKSHFKISQKYFKILKIPKSVEKLPSTLKKPLKITKFHTRCLKLYTPRFKSLLKAHTRDEIQLLD